MNVTITKDTLIVGIARTGDERVFTMSDGQVFRSWIKEIDSDGMICLADGVIINRAQIVTVTR